MAILKSKLQRTSEMVTDEHVNIILENLEKAKSIDGDVVELGCYSGTTSLFIQESLEGTGKQFHVYDSFQGVPAPAEIDETDFVKGAAKATKDEFIKNFESHKMKLPIIHEGWFKVQQYPDKICFAFFDGDFYESITDSFVNVYPKMQKGGIILVHDYGWERTKGVEKACADFLKDKPETIRQQGTIGIMEKL